MRILVCGGRHYSDRVYAWGWLDQLHYGVEPVTEVIHGSATGADEIASGWAKSRGIKETAVPANWHLYGRAAGPLRNHRMLELRPDRVIAFPGGRGTADMTRQALDAGVTVWYPHGLPVAASDASASEEPDATLPKGKGT